MLLCRVIGREDALALFAGQARAGISDLDDNFLIFAMAAQSDGPPLGHGVHRVEHQVRNGAMQQFRISSDRLNILIQFEFALNGCFACGRKLRLK